MLEVDDEFDVKLDKIGQSTSQENAWLSEARSPRTSDGRRKLAANLFSLGRLPRCSY